MVSINSVIRQTTHSHSASHFYPHFPHTQVATYHYDIRPVRTLESQTSGLQIRERATDWKLYLVQVWKLGVDWVWKLGVESL